MNLPTIGYSPEFLRNPAEFVAQRVSIVDASVHRIEASMNRKREIANLHYGEKMTLAADLLFDNRGYRQILESLALGRNAVHPEVVPIPQTALEHHTDPPKVEAGYKPGEPDQASFDLWEKEISGAPSSGFSRPTAQDLVEVEHQALLADLRHQAGDVAISAGETYAHIAQVVN